MRVDVVTIFPEYLAPLGQEIIVKGAARPGAAELDQALGVWITEIVPDPHRVQQFSPALSEADRQVLAVAQAAAVDHILSLAKVEDRKISPEELLKPEEDEAPKEAPKTETAEAPPA